MKPTKNKKRIDPRYFLNETVEEGVLGSLKSFFGGGEGPPEKEDNPVLTAFEDRLKNRLPREYEKWHNKEGLDDARKDIISLTTWIHQKRGDNISEKLISNFTLLALSRLRGGEDQVHSDIGLSWNQYAEKYRPANSV